MPCLYWLLIAVDQVWPAHCDGPPQLHWRLSRPLPRWQHLLSVWADAHDNVLLYFNVSILSQNCIENKSRGLRFSQSGSNQKWCYNKTLFCTLFLKILIFWSSGKGKGKGLARQGHHVQSLNYLNFYFISENTYFVQKQMTDVYILNLIQPHGTSNLHIFIPFLS